MLDVTKEAQEKLGAYLKERDVSAPLRVYLAYG